MTRIPNNQDLEKLFKTSFDNFEPEVNVDVWNKIQKNIPKSALQGVAATSVFSKLTGKFLIGAGAVATVVATLVYFNTNDQTGNAALSEKTETAISVDNPPSPQANNEQQATSMLSPTNAQQPTDKVEQSADKPALQPEMALKAKQEQRGNSSTNKVTNAAVNKAQEHAASENSNIATKSDRDQESGIVSNNSRPAIAATSHSGVFPLTITFSNVGRNSINRWDFGDGTFSTEKSPVHTYEKVGIYKVVLTSEDDVKDVQIIQVLSNIKVNAPNVFSPDGDGVNDEFKVTSNDAYSLHVQILDMRGKEVGRIESQEGTWNGKNVRNGEICKSGTYYYIVSGTTVDGRQFEHRGEITLKR